MNSLFINISNHPSSKWDVKQINAALKMVDNSPIIDVPFPQIDPEMSSSDIVKMADKFTSILIDLKHE